MIVFIKGLHEQAEEINFFGSPAVAKALHEKMGAIPEEMKRNPCSGGKDSILQYQKKIFYLSHEGRQTPLAFSNVFYVPGNKTPHLLVNQRQVELMYRFAL